MTPPPPPTQPFQASLPFTPIIMYVRLRTRGAPGDCQLWVRDRVELHHFHALISWSSPRLSASKIASSSLPAPLASSSLPPAFSAPPASRRLPEATQQEAQGPVHCLRRLVGS